MIDKIELFIYEDDYDLAESADEYFQPARHGYAGEEKMHRSEDGDIRCYIGNTYFGQMRLKIIFSVTKLHYVENNIGELSQEDVTSVFARVEAYFKAIGAQFNIRSAIVSRLELKRDILLDHPFDQYSGVFVHLHMRGRNIITSTYWLDGHSNGIKTGNNTHELSVYNKGVQSNTGQDNLARFEYRMKRQSAIKAEVGIRTVNDLLDNYIYLKGQYINMMKVKVFRCDIGVQPASGKVVRSNLDTLRYFMEHSRRGMQKFGVFTGLASLVDEMGGEGPVKQALIDVRYCSPARIDRMFKDFREDYNSIKNTAISCPSTSQLYHEVMAKVLDDSGVVYKPQVDVEPKQVEVKTSYTDIYAPVVTEPNDFLDTLLKPEKTEEYILDDSELG